MTVDFQDKYVLNHSSYNAKFLADDSQMYNANHAVLQCHYSGSRLGALNAHAETTETWLRSQAFSPAIKFWSPFLGNLHLIQFNLFGQN